MSWPLTVVPAPFAFRAPIDPSALFPERPSTLLEAERICLPDDDWSQSKIKALRAAGVPDDAYIWGEPAGPRADGRPGFDQWRWNLDWPLPNGQRGFAQGSGSTEPEAWDNLVAGLG